MRKLRTIAIDDRSVCQSVSHAVGLCRPTELIDVLLGWRHLVLWKHCISCGPHPSRGIRGGLMRPLPNYFCLVLIAINSVDVNHFRKRSVAR